MTARTLNTDRSLPKSSCSTISFITRTIHSTVANGFTCPFRKQNISNVKWFAKMQGVRLARWLHDSDTSYLYKKIQPQEIKQFSIWNYHLVDEIWAYFVDPSVCKLLRRSNSKVWEYFTTFQIHWAKKSIVVEKQCWKFQ